MIRSMSQTNSSFIERSMEIYRRDPQSKIFAPLAESLRREGRLDEALKIALNGVQAHPDFTSGYVALAKILLDKKEPQKALFHLQKAVELNPENHLALHLLAETQVQLRKPKEALKSYKLLLFLNPQDTKAERTIRKLESITADEYDEDIFKLAPLQIPEEPKQIQPTQNSEENNPKPIPWLERFLSLADAYIVRNDLERAEHCLKQAQQEFGLTPEIMSRLDMLNLDPRKSEDEDPPTLHPLGSRIEVVQQQKKQLLEDLLYKIKHRY